MAEVNGALQWQWIERLPLSAANTASIHQMLWHRLSGSARASHL
jgi:hypothetical protein